MCIVRRDTTWDMEKCTNKNRTGVGGAARVTPKSKSFVFDRNATHQHEDKQKSCVMKRSRPRTGVRFGGSDGGVFAPQRVVCVRVIFRIVPVSAGLKRNLLSENSACLMEWNTLDWAGRKGFRIISGDRSMEREEVEGGHTMQMMNFRNLSASKYAGYWQLCLIG